MKKLQIEKYINKNSKVLLVFPHPDDEAVFSAGLTQRISRITDKLSLICLSKGEATTLRFVPGEIKSIRRKELKLSAEILGIKKVTQKSFPDYKFKTKTRDLKDYLAKKLKNIDVVITYEPFGVTGHPDHITVSEIITKTYPGRIIYATVKKNVPPNPKGRSIEPNYYLDLTEKEKRIKMKAMSAHRSQFGIVNKAFIEKWGLRGILEREYFYIKPIEA